LRGGVFGLSCVGVVYTPMLYRLPRMRGCAEARGPGAVATYCTQGDAPVPGSAPSANLRS